MLAVKILPVACALAAGALFALQGLFNSTAAGFLGSSVSGALLSVAVSLLALLGFCLARGLPLPTPGLVAQMPAWLVPIGGVLGALILTLIIVAAPRIGTAATFALVMAGQVAASLAIDHLAPLGAPEHPMSWLRALGVAVLAVGAAIVLVG